MTLPATRTTIGKNIAFTNLFFRGCIHSIDKSRRILPSGILFLYFHCLKKLKFGYSANDCGVFYYLCSMNYNESLMPANKNAPIEVYDGKYYRYADPNYSIFDMPLSENDY